MVLGTCSGCCGEVPRSFFRMEVLLPLVSPMVMLPAELLAGSCSWLQTPASLKVIDTSFPGEPTPNDQLARVKGLNSSLLCSPTQAPGLPRGWVEAFAEAASHSNASAQFCGPHSLAGVGLPHTPYTQIPTSESVSWEIQPTLTTSTFFSAFCCSDYFGEHLRL